MLSPDLLAALLHGPAELLPVSSSGHVAAASILLGRRAPRVDDVELHAGPLLALLVARRGEAAAALRRLDGRRLAMHALAGGIPSAAGLVIESRRARRGDVAAGMLAGAALLALAGARQGERSRWEAGPRDGLWLGLSQACALWPGISRNGATLAVARLRGIAPEEANALSREVGVPVTAGAIALRALRARRPPRPAAVTASFASSVAALPLLRLVDRGGRLWPWAAYRAGVALVLLRESRRDG